MQISRMCALMERNGVPVTDEIPEDDEPHFIPSACWRKLAPGITSTTRFMGVLLAYGRKYAVYDIGNGSMEWQMKAEVSLFSRKYNSYETRADGMILICDDGKREAIAERIIRHTMWHRRRLLKTQYTETNKPVAYSHSSIMVRPQYEHVYLTTYDPGGHWKGSGNRHPQVAEIPCVDRHYNPQGDPELSGLGHLQPVHQSDHQQPEGDLFQGR